MLLMGLAAWQPAVRKRATGDELPSILTPIGLALASLGLLVYDHFEPTNLLALGLASAALVAALIRLSLTHRAEPRQPRQHPPPGAHRRPHRARQPIRAAARARRRAGRAGRRTCS